MLYINILNIIHDLQQLLLLLPQHFILHKVYTLALSTKLMLRVLFTASRIERECPNRHYVFERHTRKKLKLPPSEYKEMIAANRTDCEDKCLNEFTFVCRSATYDSASKTCWLSRFTRRSHPELLEEDPSSDYLENTCLNGNKRNVLENNIINNNCNIFFKIFYKLIL